MQVPEGDNAGPRRNTLRTEFMSQEKDTLLEKMKANNTIFEPYFSFSQIFIYEWTLSVRQGQGKVKAMKAQL